MSPGLIAKKHVQVQRIHALLEDVVALLANQPRGRIAYGPTLPWGFWLAFPGGRGTFLAAAAHGPDHRLVELETTAVIATEDDVARIVQGKNLAQITAIGDGIEDWLKAPRFRRMVDVIRERTRALVGRRDNPADAPMRA